MDQDELRLNPERVKLCRIVALLMLVDGEVSQGEQAFLEDLMDRYWLGDEERRQVRGVFEAPPAAFLEDIEALRRGGLARDLLGELEAAALADGEFARVERAMIARVRRIIQYRLGASDYVLPLEQLSDAPLWQRYEVHEQLGEGGFSVVHAARDQRTQQRCVIKRLKTPLNPSADLKLHAAMEDRFWREVSLISRLQSPHTIRLLDAGFDGGVPYMVLEHLDGLTLREAVRAQPLTPARARHVMLQVLDAVAEAHDHGIVHRDLKPDNIMLVGRQQQTAKVLDFGLSGIVMALREEGHFAITSDRQAIGTPPYMAPEQVSQGQVPRRETDIYALGLILCECLTGRRVFGGRRSFEIMMAQLSGEAAPIPAQVLAGPFGALVRRACDKDWRRRFGPPRDLIEQVEAAEAAGDEARARELHRDLYRVHSPADEMIGVLQRIDVSRVQDAPPAQPPRRSLVRLLKGAFGR